MKSIKQISVHVTRVALAERQEPYNRAIQSSRDVASLARSLTDHIDHEVFLVFCLDSKNRITGYVEASRGGTASCVVEPAQVFRAAIVQGAVSIIVAHNHPSGDCAPSDADMFVTVKLRKAGELLGISVLDHVIVAGGSQAYYSFLDSGTLRSSAA